MPPFDDAVRCWQQGRRPEAEILCRTAIEDDPGHTSAQRLLAEILIASGRGAEAIIACRRIAELEPDDAANLRRLAQLLSQGGDSAAAIVLLERSLRIEPDNARALNNMGNLLTELGRAEEAIPVLERAIAVQPAYPIASNNLGNALARLGRLPEAIASYERALALHERFPEALVNLARTLTAAGRLSEALRCHERADALRSPDADALTTRAHLLLALARPADALAAFDRAVGSSPGSADARIGRIHALLSLDRAQDALAACDELLALHPELAGVRGLRATALLGLERASEALTAATEATTAEPGDAQAFVTLGFAAVTAGLPTRALPAFDQAVTLRPMLAKAHAGRGLALAALGHAVDALAAYARARELDPRDARVFVQAGDVMLGLGHAGTAHAAFCAALELQPHDPGAREGRVMALISMNRYEEALPELAALSKNEPRMDYLPGYQLYTRLQCCDWSDSAAASSSICESVRRGERADLPFSFMAHNDSSADQLQCAKIYTADKCSAPADAAVQRPPRRVSQRLRVGYLSSDFRDHPVAQLVAGVLERHDRTRFETYAFSAGPDDGSELRKRLERGFDEFLDVAPLTDEAIAARMADLGIDIAVDLGGHTLGSRTRALAFRPAPVQLTYLGYPGTLGAEYIDYIIADRHVIPEADRIHFSEQVVYLPDTYLPSSLAPQVTAPASRAAAQLPATGCVYCCFNAPFKLSPHIFDAWMRILRAVPGSVLWLRDASAAVAKNLSIQAERRGVDATRLIHAPRVPSAAEHYARLALADVFLDTHPYNAHATAHDALAAGVPVITRPGRAFASRVATSLLHAVTLGHLSVETPQKYEDLAIQLGRAPDMLAELKRQLAQSRTSAALFDTARLCRHLEAAYSEIWARHARGERPSTLWVERDI